MGEALKVYFFFPLGFCLLASAATMESAADTNSVTVLIVTTIIGFLTMIAQQFFAASKARQDHAWEVEKQDRKDAQDRADRLNAASEVKVHTEAAAQLVLEKQESIAADLKHHSQVTARITAGQTEAVKEKITEAAEVVKDEAGSISRRMEQLEKNFVLLLNKLQRDGTKPPQR